MSGTTKETLKTPEIKTPEELIKRLESKSQKTLADKVRTIEQTVTDSTESKWKKLQAELPESEKKEIETILKDENPEVGTRLKTIVDDSQEKMDKALKTGGIAAVLGVATAGVAHEAAKLKDKSGMGFIDGIVGFFENLSNKWDMLTKSISNWFASSFPSLAKMFGIEASTSSSQVKPDVKNEEDEKKKKEEEAKEQKGYEKYILKSTAFIKGITFFKRNNSEFLAMTMLSHDTGIQNMKFQQIKSYSDKSDLQSLHLGSGVNTNTAHEFMKILKKPAIIKTIEKSYYRMPLEFRDKTKIDDLTFKQIVGMIGTNMQIYNKVSEGISNTKFRAPLIPDFIQDLQHMGNRIGGGLSGNNEKPTDTSFEDKAHELGISAQMAAWVYLGGASTLGLKWLNVSNLAGVENKSLSDVDKTVLLEKIQPFGQKLNTIILEKFTFGDPEMKRQFETFLNKNPLSIAEIMDYYILFSGETDSNNLTDHEITLGMLRFWKVLGKNPNLRGETFDRTLLQKFTKLIYEDSVHIPQPLREMLIHIQSTLFEQMKEIFGETINALGPTGILAITAAIFLIIFLGIKLVPATVAVAAVTAVGGALVAILAAAGIIMAGGKEAKVIESKGPEINNLITKLQNSM